MWDVIKLLIKETNDMNDKGRSFDIASSVSQQLPFFSCGNVMIKPEHQKSISQYIYCKEFGIAPFPGAYGQQPHRWIAKVNIIKNAMSRREERMQKQAQRQAEMKAGTNNG